MRPAIQNKTIPKGYKQTEIGVIPDDWDVITYNEAFDFLSTATYSRAELSVDGDIKYIHYGDIHTRFEHHLNLKVNLPKISLEKSKRYSLIKNGDIIMADASEDYEGVGKSVEVLNHDNSKAISGLHTFLLRGNDNFVNGYKAYISQNPLVKNSFQRLATGMKVYGVSKTNLKNILIPKPPKKEQQAIAEVLSDTDNCIESIQNLIAKKKAIKQGTMQELLTGKKRLAGFSGKWERKKLGEVASIQRGASPRPINNPIWFNEKSSVGWVRISDVTKVNKYLSKTTQKLSEDGIRNSRYVNKGNLIMSICATIGKPIITKINVCIHDGFVVFRDLDVNENFMFEVVT